MGKSKKRKGKKPTQNQASTSSGNTAQNGGKPKPKDDSHSIEIAGASAGEPEHEGPSKDDQNDQKQPRLQEKEDVEATVDQPVEEEAEGQDNDEKFYPCSGNSAGEDFVFVEGMSPQLLRDAGEGLDALMKMFSVCQEIYGNGSKRSVASGQTGVPRDGQMEVTVREELEKEKEEILEENRVLKEEKDVMEQKMKELTKEKGEIETVLKKNEEELKKALINNKKTEAVLNTNEARVQNLEKEKQKLQNQHKTAQEHKKKVGELTRELENSKRKLNENEQDKRSLNWKVQRMAKEGEGYRQEIGEYEERVRQLKVENDNLSSSLSKIMNDRMNQDESQVENVCIKARPLKLVDEFELFCTDEWLAAKNDLDECTDVNFLMSEERKQKILLDILMEASRVSAKQLDDYMAKMRQLLDNPLEMQCEKQTAPIEELDGTSIDGTVLTYHVEGAASSGTKTKLPSELETEIHKYLKIHSENITCNTMAKLVLSKVLQSIPDTEIDLQTKSSDSLLKYAISSCILTWKMAIQRPPMSFTADEDVGKDYNSDMYDLQFGTMDPKTPGVKILRSVYPSMWHNGKLLKKGKVILGHYLESASEC